MAEHREDVGALRPGADVLEIGSGTSQATQELLRRGARVTAVELGESLVGVLRTRLSSSRPPRSTGSTPGSCCRVSRRRCVPTAGRLMPEDRREETPRAMRIDERIDELTLGGYFERPLVEVIRWNASLSTTQVKALGEPVSDPFMTVVYAARARRGPNGR